MISKKEIRDITKRIKRKYPNKSEAFKINVFMTKLNNIARGG